MSIAQTVGARIRACRERAGMTQAELAAAFVTRQSVGNWEGGKTLPDVQSLQLVAQALDTTVDGLLGDEVPAISRGASLRSPSCSFSISSRALSMCRSCVAS